MCFIQFSESTPVISLSSSNILVIIMDTEQALCEAGILF